MGAEENTATPGMSPQERSQTARNVLDLTLKEIERRMRENPAEAKASQIAEVTKLLALFWRFQHKLDKDTPETEGLHELLRDLPQYEDDDADDPLLFQGSGELPQPTVTPADIAALAKFGDDD